jgi:hypothetical protein
LLALQVQRLDGVALDDFNAWHPSWTFEESATGRERRTIATEPRASVVHFPFRSSTARLVVTDVEANATVAVVDLLPAAHAFCRAKRVDPACVALANREPTCRIAGANALECSGSHTFFDLDGRGSTDPDNDPIVKLEWLASPSGVAKAGPTVSMGLPGVGGHDIALTVTDDLSGMATCHLPVTVADTAAPKLECNAPPTIGHRSRRTLIKATANDGCAGAVPAIVVSSTCYRVDHHGRKKRVKHCDVRAVGATLRIRDPGKMGDTIEWHVESTDPYGNTGLRSCAIVVVKSRKPD